MAGKPSDIHSIRELLDQLRQFSYAKKALPILRPLLSLFGVDTNALEKSLQDIEELRAKASELARTLDRFNELFAPRGWIAYDKLDPEIAKLAVATAEAGDLPKAEQILLDSYSPDQVAVKLRTLWGVSAFRPRLRLAELALVDYRETRYHSCIPVVLALLDGMVNELEDQGFFSNKANLNAWDSIAACDEGLNELKRLLFKTRAKTVTDPIELPYRNGILHGMDLAYDTPLVAAKCWAALFATADWARQIERGNKEAPAVKPALTWRECLARRQQATDQQQALDGWRPRENVDPTNPAEGSPEAGLMEFLSAWKSKNYGAMAKRLNPYDQRSLGARAGLVREHYRFLELHEFTLEAICDKAPAVSEIEVRGSGTQYSRAFDHLGTFRLVQFDGNQQPVIHGLSGGDWFIMNENPWQSPVAFSLPV